MAAFDLERHGVRLGIVAIRSPTVQIDWPGSAVPRRARVEVPKRRSGTLLP